MRDVTADQLRQMLLGETDEPRTRGFRPVVPPSKDGLCPAADNATPPMVTPAGSRATDGGSSRGFVPYSPSNPGVQMALEFKTGSDELAAGEQRLLQRLASAMMDPRLASRKFAVAGHTDATGSDSVNLILSCSRALAVKRYLVGRGIQRDRLSAYGFGSRRPLERDVLQSARNRRVEVRSAP